MSPPPAPCAAMRYEAIDTRSGRVFADRNIRRAQTRNRTRAQWPGAAASRASRPASAQDIQMRRYRTRARESVDVPPAAWGSKPSPQTPPFRRYERVLLCLSSILAVNRVKAAMIQSIRELLTWSHRVNGTGYAIGCACICKSRGKTHFAVQSNLVTGSVQPNFEVRLSLPPVLNRDIGIVESNGTIFHGV